jgi:RNA polymerase sigma-70 factor, ECF subfamily
MELGRTRGDDGRVWPPPKVTAACLTASRLSPRSSPSSSRSDDEPSDIKLINGVASGNFSAVGILYDRHATTLFPIGLRILHDRSDAEDALHDAFVGLTDRAAHYRPDRGTFVAWLITLMRNLCIDRLRRRGRREWIARKVIAHEPAPAVGTPESLAADATQRAKARGALASLPKSSRATLEMAFFEGLSYPEIAERQGVPLGTVKSRVARALATLREALE